MPGAIRDSCFSSQIKLAVDAMSVVHPNHLVPIPNSSILTVATLIVERVSVVFGEPRRHMQAEHALNKVHIQFLQLHRTGGEAKKAMVLQVSESTCVA